MSDAQALTAEQWEELAKPFDPEWIEKLPKNLRKGDDNKGRCSADVPPNGKGGPFYSADGHYCGGWHARSVHLDYVGHAGITMRLNDVLGPGGWDFTPYAETADGLPMMTSTTFYARLTIGGVTKWDVAAQYGGPQEALGDALRRCAMRFGVGTYLWSKSEHALNMAAVQDQPPEPPPEQPQGGQQQPQGGQDPAQGQQGRPPHVERVFALLRDMPESDKAEMIPWWDDQAQAGNLPTRENKAQVTEPQARWIMEVALGIQQRREDADRRRADEGGQETLPDPQ